MALVRQQPPVTRLQPAEGTSGLQRGMEGAMVPPTVSGGNPLQARLPPQVVVEVWAKGKRGNCSFCKLTGSSRSQYHQWQPAETMKAGRSNSSARLQRSSTPSQIHALHHPCSHSPQFLNLRGRGIPARLPHPGSQLSLHFSRYPLNHEDGEKTVTIPGTNDYEIRLMSSPQDNRYYLTCSMCSLWSCLLSLGPELRLSLWGTIVGYFVVLGYDMIVHFLISFLFSANCYFLNP